jgi:hypothetical protein
VRLLHAAQVGDRIEVLKLLSAEHWVYDDVIYDDGQPNGSFMHLIAAHGWCGIFDPIFKRLLEEKVVVPDFIDKCKGMTLLQAVCAGPATDRQEIRANKSAPMSAVSSVEDAATISASRSSVTSSCSTRSDSSSTCSCSESSDDEPPVGVYDEEEAMRLHKLITSVRTDQYTC